MDSLRDQTFRIRGSEVLPIVQGGMGIGVSAYRLPGTVAGLGAVGIVASVELRHMFPDLMASCGRDNASIRAANIEALARAVARTHELSRGKGRIWANIMHALEECREHVRQACESGVHGIVMGAGLPLDLPELTVGYPDVALVPILSESHGVSIILRRWMKRYKRLPDAIVIENPSLAGGHLGAKDVAAVNDPKFDFDVVLPKIFGVYKDLRINASDAPPIIVAGGISSPEQIRKMLALGASAVQIGTAFAVTEEGDAHENFKRVLLEAKELVVFMSAAGMPARAVITPWLRGYLADEERIKSATIRRTKCVRRVQCLSYCGLTDPKATTAGRFCIEKFLANAVHGDVKEGLFFRGAGTLPFKDIRPVRDLMEFLLDEQQAFAA